MNSNFSRSRTAIPPLRVLVPWVSRETVNVVVPVPCAVARTSICAVATLCEVGELRRQLVQRANPTGAAGALAPPRSAAIACRALDRYWSKHSERFRSKPTAPALPKPTGINTNVSQTVDTSAYDGAELTT
jgi:hypothetical protein